MVRACATKKNFWSIFSLKLHFLKCKYFVDTSQYLTSWLIENYDTSQQIFCNNVIKIPQKDSALTLHGPNEQFLALWFLFNKTATLCTVLHDYTAPQKKKKKFTLKDQGHLKVKWDWENSTKKSEKNLDYDFEITESYSRSA